MEARLRPTGKVGQSVLIVRVEEANPLIGSLGVDNYSPPSIGAERSGVELRRRNLTGMGDELAGYIITRSLVVPMSLILGIRFPSMLWMARCRLELH